MNIKMKIAAVSAATIAVTALALASASASTRDTHAALAAQATQGVPAHAVKVALTLDCGLMSQQARAYAVSHHYCLATTRTGHDTPDGVSNGNCGESWLVLWNEGGGNAEFSYGFQSSLGNVVYRSLGLNWTNWSTGGSGSFGDSSWMNSSYYNESRIRYTSAGFVTGSMGGWVQLWWGGTCSIIPPSDYANVTW